MDTLTQWFKKGYVNHWGRQLGTFPVPVFLFENEALALPADALAVYLVLLHLYKSRSVRDQSQLLASVRVGQQTLMDRTGYRRDAVITAIKRLDKAGFISQEDRRKKRGEFAANEYCLCRPSQKPKFDLLGHSKIEAETLTVKYQVKNGKPIRVRNIFYAHGIGYFLMPSCIIKEHAAHWSLAHMTGTELRLYVAMLYLVNRHRRLEFSTDAAELKRLAGKLAKPTFDKALDGLGRRGLVFVTGTYNVHLCDPYTGEPLQKYEVDEDDPANYRALTDGGRETRLNLNIGDAQQIEQLIRSCLPSDEVPGVQGNGDLTICCPFHTDTNASCSVSPRKNGCFHCFGCHKSGSLTDLVTQLRQETKAQTIQHIGKVFGATVTYRDPDVKATAIYSYKDGKGKLLKQVLRYLDVDGKKVFRQRRPAKGGGWIWNTAGVPTTLFNMELLESADTVCITEGEKDACTVTDLHLLGGSGLVIGMTSGGAESWDAELAQYLRGKKVIVMPDADAAGEKFAASVTASLDAERIEHRVVTFGDVDAKDVTEFRGEHTVEDLVRRMGTDWVRMPDGQRLDSLPESETLESVLDGDITI